MTLAYNFSGLIGLLAIMAILKVIDFFLEFWEDAPDTHACKGGQNPPNTSSKRPPPPQGSGERNPDE